MNLPFEAKRKLIDKVQVARLLQPADAQHTEETAIAQLVRVKRAMKEDVDLLFRSCPVAEEQLVVLWQRAIGREQREAGLNHIGGLRR